MAADVCIAYSIASITPEHREVLKREEFYYLCNVMEKYHTECVYVDVGHGFGLKLHSSMDIVCLVTLNYVIG